MRRRAVAFPIALAMLAMLAMLVGAGAACGDGSAPSSVNGIDTLQADDVAQVSAPEDPAVMDRTVKEVEVDRFAGDLVVRLSGDSADHDHPSTTESLNTENLVVSPLSAAYAFGMLEAGHEGRLDGRSMKLSDFPTVVPIELSTR